MPQRYIFSLNKLLTTLLMLLLTLTVGAQQDQLIVRDEIMEDWGQRWLWLRE